MNNQTHYFAAGTKAECNRCHVASPLPKECLGYLDHESASGVKVFRLSTMCTLPNCGHMDAHWIIRTGATK